MRATEATVTLRREVEVCNACRYCEGFCAVFPAIERKRSFTEADLSYLANLCHNCRGCYYACQYAPPHQWGINLPRSFQQVRAESYEQYAWPPSFAQLFQHNGAVMGLALAAGIALVLILTMLAQAPGTLFLKRPVVPGAFYDVIPLWAMQVAGIATFGFSLVALAMGARAFWRDAGAERRITLRGALLALHDIATLRNLGGGGYGCNDNSERFSMTRRRLHHAMAYGFLLCFAATCVGFIYHACFGWAAPYSFLSLPVLLGTLGGIGLLVGTIGLFAMKLVADPGPSAPELLGADVALLLLLALAAATGLLLLLLRATSLMPIVLALHLGTILAFFVTIPYSKMVHAVYRGAALLRNALEKDLAALGGAGG
jgi:citrate/tricarballylate utilization protein